jgi:hypothetical protein
MTVSQGWAEMLKKFCDARVTTALLTPKMPSVVDLD